MMDIILLLLLSYSFCDQQPLPLKKYGSVTTTERIGLVYLDIEDFEDDSTIYIQLNVYNSHLDNKVINYDFTNFIPNSTYEPLKNKEFSYSGSSTTEGITGSSFASYYYYKFTKQNKMKYLVMKYWDFYNDSTKSNSYLEIENTRSSLLLILIIILTVVVLIIITGIIFFCVIRVRRRKDESLIYNQPDILANQSKNQNVSEEKTENQPTPYDQQQQYEKPQDLSTENPPTPYDQQQYIESQDQNSNYYEAPPVNPINYSKNSSQYSIEKENC